MVQKFQFAVLSLLALIVVWSANSQRAVVSEVSALSERINLMEERAGGMEGSRADRREGKAARQGKRKMGAKAKAHLARQAGGGSGDTGSTQAGAAELTQIKEDLRDELVGMVAEEQEVASEERHERRRARFVDGMRESVAEFVEERSIEEAVALQIQGIVDAGIEEGMKLHQEMKNEDISYYEFRKEMKANREAFEADLSNVVEGEDYEALMELFPSRH
jgi:hypothetical protein